MDENDIPKPLRDWRHWVSKGHENFVCPFLFNSDQKRYCAWPGGLSLNLNNNGGNFSQTWRIYSDSWIGLPGNSRIWPQQVTINKKPALVVERNGLPMLFLNAGQYQILGRFEWQQAPTTLPIPNDTGIVNLSLNNKVIDFPRRENNALWLQAAQTTQSVNRFSYQVFRHIDDSIPANVTFNLNLQVSGVARQETLQLPISENFTPLQLSSSMPARLNEQNQLTLQVRPGNWVVSLVYRHSGVLNELRFEPPKQTWVDEEVWVFQSRPALRIVEISGMDSIDPQQTELPANWKNLPAYRAVTGSSLQFTEQRRGDPNPGDDQLELRRTLWLNFDGGGFTLVDNILGSKKTQWRMEMQSPMKLGQVIIGGQDQFITQLQDSQRAGVEIREGQVNIQAISQLENNHGVIPAVGWAQNMQKVSAVLNLPPGYRVFSVTGADSVSSTWITRWTLLDIFLVLLITVAVGQLRGHVSAAIAFITLLLTYQESGSPVILWLMLIFGLALLKVLKSGQLRKWILAYHYLVCIALLIVIVPFFVEQIRTSIYPQLEPHYYSPTSLSFNAPAQLATQPAASPPATLEESDIAQDEVRSQDKMSFELERKTPARRKMLSLPAEGMASLQDKSYEKMIRYDPAAVKQTGPGLPDWNWNQVYINWSGPVAQDQEINVNFISPALNAVLAWLRVIFVIALLLALLKFDIKTKRISLPGHTNAMLFAAFIAMVMTAHSGAAQAEQFPDQNLLKEFEERLFEAPDCLPNCAAISDMSIDIRSDRMNVEFTVSVLELNSIPLPGDFNHWHIDKIIVDGAAVDAVVGEFNQRLMLGLNKGQHHVRLEGKLSSDNKLQFNLPLKPFRIDTKSQGWEVAGIHPDGSIDAQLQFSRAEKSSEKLEFDSAQLPAFVKVERRLIFGLNWTVQTRVQRISPMGSAVLLNIPLIEGESVITPEIKVEGNIVKLNLPANQFDIGWESNLAMNDSNNQARRQISLSAANTSQWIENWEIDVSPIWHMQYEGIPVVRHQLGNLWKPAWQPWPGESLVMNITRPSGIQGQSLTIDKSDLTITPGLRLTDARLALNLRSSQGNKHTIQLPPQSQLQEVNLNGKILPLRLEQNSLTLPIDPGEQKFIIKFQVPGGITPVYSALPIDLNIASVNHSVNIAVPDNRWTLFVQGPRLGPAVLIWGELIVILLLAYPLTRLRQSIPLKYWQWSLLILGLLPISFFGMLVVATWFVVVSIRETAADRLTKWQFNLLQIVLLSLTFASVVILGLSVSSGLLGSPDMSITGNGSNSHFLRWYQDIVAARLPSAHVISIPMYIYRIFMLLWALWMAFSIIRWAKWAWKSFTINGYWRSVDIKITGRLNKSDISATAKE